MSLHETCSLQLQQGLRQHFESALIVKQLALSLAKLCRIRVMLLRQRRNVFVRRAQPLRQQFK